MTRDQVVDIVRARCGNIRGKDDIFLMELAYVQQTILEGNSWLPWFLESELSEASTTIGERRLAFPNDFLSEIEEQELLLVMPDGTEVPFDRKGSFDELRKAYPGSGRPVAYATVGEYFAFFPLPDAVYGIRTRYYAKDADMTAANVETKWLKHASGVVIAALGVEFAGKHLKNAALAAEFKADFSVAYDKLYKRHTALDEVNQSRSM